MYFLFNQKVLSIAPQNQL